MIVGFDFSSLILYLILTCMMLLIFYDYRKFGSTSVRNAYRFSFTKADFRLFIFWTIMTFVAVFRVVNAKGVGGVDLVGPGGYLENFFDSDVWGKYIWTDLKDMITLQSREPLLYIFFYIVRLFTTNFRIMFFFYYGFIFYCIMQFLKFFSIDFKGKASLVAIPAVMFTYLYSFSSMRTSLGIAFLFLAIIAFENKKRRCVIFLILSVLSHYILLFPSFVMLTEYFISNYGFRGSISRRTWVKYTLIFEFTFFSLYSIIYTILLKTKYHGYIDQRATVLGQLPYIVLGILCIIFYNDFKKEFGMRIWMIDAAIVDAILIPFAIFLGFYRLHAIFVPFEIVAYGALVVIIGKKYKPRQFIYLLGYAFYASYYIYRFYRYAYGMPWGFSIESVIRLM